jgi:hypothetical protein
MSNVFPIEGTQNPRCTAITSIILTARGQTKNIGVLCCIVKYRNSSLRMMRSNENIDH